MNRTDRLYALVEELRAVSPRPRSAAWLARRFEISARTVERDLETLRATGVPIWSEPGRNGGYALDRDRTLPPLALSAAEALAITVALRSIGESPFADHARTASQKVLATLPSDVRAREAVLASRIYRVGNQIEPDTQRHRVIADAIELGRVVHLTYSDQRGVETERDVEPLGLLWAERGWYLIGFCRMRNAVRGFVLDGIRTANMLDDVSASRVVELDAELDRIDARQIRDD